MPRKIVAVVPPGKANAGGRGAVRLRKNGRDIAPAADTLRDVAALIIGTGRPDDGYTFKYYDTEAAAFRSFRVENLIAIY